MKESIGYTVSLNIMIVFITIIVSFFCAALIYFKSNKASNIITSAIEKYEGYNEYANDEISKRLTSLGYYSREISCKQEIPDKGAYGDSCSIVESTNSNIISDGSQGYCVYECSDKNYCKEVIENGSVKIECEYKYYKIRTNMMLNIPIINDKIDIPIYSNTNRLYLFTNTHSDTTESCSSQFEGKICQASGSLDTYGTKVTCCVNNSTERDFYVFGNELSKIKLIMTHNICEDGELTSTIKCSTHATKADMFLSTATKDWSNIAIKRRLTADEAINLGCTAAGPGGKGHHSCPWYLYTNLANGYWIGDTYKHNGKEVCNHVCGHGCSTWSYAEGSTQGASDSENFPLGVRPVIEIDKRDINGL